MKYNKLFFTIFLSCILSIFMLTEIKAQSFTFTTQEQVNAFDDEITSISGSLIIGQFLNESDIIDLTPLSSLTSIDGSLVIVSTSALTSLNGLNELTYVGGNLTVQDNHILTNLDGLSNITFIGGEINIPGNPLLENLDGLSGLTSIEGTLNITGNDALTNLNGLSGVTSIGNRLLVQSNPLLENLDGLTSLTSVGGYLVVFRNVALRNLDGLSNLTFVGEDAGSTISFRANSLLDNFCGIYPLFSEGTIGNGRIEIAGYTNPTPEEIEVIFADCAPLTPEEMIAELITSVDGSGIHKGTKRLLTGFLNSADKSLDKGREKLAILKLVAFKWLVKVQSPRKIDAALADEWIGKAEEIIDAIKTALPKSGELDELASEDVLPETYNLNQNYPNPFNPTTTISYSIPENEYVTLSIYDALGKEVAVLDNGFRTAGNYSHTFDASNLSSGMYFYTIQKRKLCSDQENAADEVRISR